MIFYIKILFKAFTCGLNQVYKVQNSCAKTCFHPDGIYDCGEIKPVEGCFCNDGLILDSTGNCTQSSNCGCLLPDNTGFLGVIKIRN